MLDHEPRVEFLDLLHLRYVIVAASQPSRRGNGNYLRHGPSASSTHFPLNLEARMFL